MRADADGVVRIPSVDLKSHCPLFRGNDFDVDGDGITGHGGRLVGEVHGRTKRDFALVEVITDGLHAGPLDDANHVPGRQHLGHGGEVRRLGQQIRHRPIRWNRVGHGVFDAGGE